MVTGKKRIEIVYVIQNIILIIKMLSDLTVWVNKILFRNYCLNKFLTTLKNYLIIKWSLRRKPTSVVSTEIEHVSLTCNVEKNNRCHWNSKPVLNLITIYWMYTEHQSPLLSSWWVYMCYNILGIFVTLYG